MNQAVFLLPRLFPKVCLMALGAVAFGLVSTGTAAADESGALRNCTVETKVMAGEFARLGAYMESPDADDAFARQILGGVESALKKAQAACSPFPEMDEILAPLASEVARMDAALSR